MNGLWANTVRSGIFRNDVAEAISNRVNLDSEIVAEIKEGQNLTKFQKHALQRQADDTWADYFMCLFFRKFPHLKNGKSLYKRDDFFENCKEILKNLADAGYKPSNKLLEIKAQYIGGTWQAVLDEVKNESFGEFPS
jgi:hypothetical protein